MRYCFLLTSLFLIGSVISQEITEKISIKTNYDTLGIFDEDLLPPSFHAGNRNKVRALMPERTMAIYYAGTEKVRSNDVSYEFHQDPDFYYLTGLNEPNSVLFLFKEPTVFKEDTIQELLLLKKRNPQSETWVGKKLGVDGSELVLEVQKSYDIDEFNMDSLNLLDFDSIFYHDTQKEFRKKSIISDSLLQDMTIDESESRKWMNQLREIKTEEEMILMRKAISITCDAQNEMMKVLKPEMKEYQAEAVVEAVFKMNGAEYPGYPSIVGAAENSCILHYTTNRKTMKGNHLLLSDVGAEYHGYTADVTRTMPVDGKFSKEEKIIYNIVLEAQDKAIEACVPGNPFYITNTIATTVISQRLQELGLIKSPFEIRRYFMHGTSHYLGLDVHDAGTRGEFQPNTVITVEPGIYIKEGSPCDTKWWNIGVRIEDDILITDSLPENLSGCIPRSTNEIEKMMKLEPTLFKDF